MAKRNETTWKGKVLGKRVVLRDPDKFAQFVASLEGKEILLTLAELRYKRTLDQNALYWVYLRVIVESTDGLPTRERIDALHEYLKRELLEPVTETVKLPNGKVISFRRPKSTTELDTLEMSRYMKAIELLTEIPVPTYEL